MMFLRALKFAFHGIRDSFKTERNFRIQVAFAVGAAILGGLLGINPAEWLWIGLSIFLVLAAELFNTALEAVTDLASPAKHNLAKKAKDAAAAGVLMLAIFSIICGFIIFLPKLAQVIKHLTRVT
ncbi:diacylglycerol kinase family protein [Olivibacter sp. XZL3]|uniref:diacylglycerol kinase family protein n=1 Tax=Olivibacter sp. XZL3 TaxID=1735116 RepID=UPI00106633B0|nr:diacylglycerol kinase family protein [Olivibacter sp. XZL3]